MKNKNILIILPAQNFSEHEFVITKTILSRSGFNLFVASDTAGLCIGDNHLKVKADMNLLNIHEANFAGIVFIGGAGIADYRQNKHLHSIINKFNDAAKIVAAICAAPIILAEAGILGKKKATCFPARENELTRMDAIYSQEPVVISNNIITARDFTAAEEFAFAIAEYR